MTQPTINYFLGLEITGGSVTHGLLGTSYSFNPTSIYTPLSGYTAVPVWYVYNSLTQTYTKVTDPTYTASITSRSLSNGDTSVTLGTSSSLLTLGGNYSNLTYPNNDIRGIFHNGIRTEYENGVWGNSVTLQNISNFGQLDAITKFFLESGPKTVSINVSLSGNPGTGQPTETENVVITQSVNNLSLSSESLNTYVGQTYFGRKIYPNNSDGSLNLEYFDGVKYE
jgi:hypothetical protein